MRVGLPRINRQPELALSTHNHKYGCSGVRERPDEFLTHGMDEVTDVKFNGSLQKRLVLIDGEEESGSGVREYEGDERRSRRKNKRREEKTCVIVWYLRRKHPYTEPEHLQ
ncbi:hypothetical protein T08_4818 [Trichinella sp. T8]|nr:hypothetical protein T08_4818 [Trichinella sp. T8]